MKLTRKQAIDKSKELWTFCAETGLPKEDWPEWEKYEDIVCDCFLCAYDKQLGLVSNWESCPHCPYSEKFGACEGDDTPYSNWDSATTEEDRKKYAGEFLAQLEQL